jgi:imidazolonepropionase-like amidohydrolase
LHSYGWIWHTTAEAAARHHRANHTYNVHGVEEARAAVLKTIEGGADMVKLWNGSTPEEVRVVAEEAHKRGLKVTGHTSGDQDLIARVTNGQDGVEHTGFDASNPEVVRLLLARRTVVVPTPITQLASYLAFEWPEWRNDPRARLLTPPAMWTEIRDSLEHMDRLPYFGGAYRGRSAYDQAARTVKTLYDAGVRMALGTDSGTPANFHVDSTWRQMELYVTFGIPPMEVIGMATRQAAAWMGIAAKTGTIVPGKAADIIIVDGNPLSSMSALKDPVYVFKDGVQYKGPVVTRSAVTKPSAQ